MEMSTMIDVTPPSTQGTMHHQQVVDTAYLLEKDVGANSEGGDAKHKTKRLVPMEELDERALHKIFTQIPLELQLFLLR